MGNQGNTGEKPVPAVNKNKKSTRDHHPAKNRLELTKKKRKRDRRTEIVKKGKGAKMGGRNFRAGGPEKSYITKHNWKPREVHIVS